LSGTGTLGGSVTTSSASSNVGHLAPGVNTPGSNFGSAGTLTIAGAVTIGGGTALDFDLATATTVGANFNDLITLTGTGANGVLTIGGTGITVNFNTLSPLTTGTAYTLINGATSILGFSAGDFTATGTGSLTATFTDSSSGVFVTFNTASLTAAYFNGQGTDLNTLGNYDTTASSGTAVSSLPTGVTDIYFSANRNGSTVPNLSAPLTVNSVNFGTGTGTKSGITVSSSSTSDPLTIEASAGNGITIATGGGNDTISAPVVLGASQTWTATDAASTLNVSGQVSGGFALSTAGAGTIQLSNAAGNTYTGTTTVGGTSTLLVTNTNTSSSATGTGSVSVGPGATLAGTGFINASVSGKTFSISGASGNAATVLVGHTSATDNTTGGSLSLQAAAPSNIANANLVFNLNSAVAGSGNELLVGSTPITFGLGTQSTTLTLNLVGTSIIPANTPYILIAGTNGGLDQYTNLSLGTPTGNITTGLYTPISSSGVGGTGNLVLSIGAAGYYNNSYLFLYQNSTTNGGVDDIEVMVVPEPSTWAMILGGLALLVFIQRRKNKLMS